MSAQKDGGDDRKRQHGSGRGLGIRFRPAGVSPARYAAVMGLLFAAAAVLNWLESLFSAYLPAGMRVGLSNIVIMLAILCVNLPSSVLLVILKAAFVLMTRGATAGAMSLCGGAAAFTVTAMLLRKTKSSYILISVLGALAHTLGQICAARVILGTSAVFACGAALGIGSLAAGIVTGIVLRTVFPVLAKTITNQL